MDKNTISVLIVDNDADYAGVVKHHLQAFQASRFNVDVAPNGDDALSRLGAAPPIDIVLMNYDMPNGNGLEITRRISEGPHSVPIILLTSGRDFRIAIEAMKYGVEEYLVREQAVDTMLPRTIAGVLERTKIKKRIHDAEREKLISQKRTEAIRELVVTMCHEFNNPLAAIKISVDILARQSIEPPDKKLLAELNSNISLLEKQIIRLRDLNQEAQGPAGPEQAAGA
jgi:DNA-binding NtrC family response regulator